MHGSGVTAPPFGCSASSAGCHGTCSSFSFVTAAPVSFAALHSTAPHFRFITPRSLLKKLLQGMAHPACHPELGEGWAHAFRKPTTRLTGFHSASFVAISFQYCSVHPLPIFFARRLSPFRLRSLSAALITMPDTWLIRPSFRHAALSSLASFRRLRALREIYFGGSTWSWHRHSFLMALLPAPHGGSQARPVVPPSRDSS